MSSILRLDASARREGSRTRALADAVVGRLLAADPGARVVARDLFADPVPPIDEAWVRAAFAPPEAQDAASVAARAASDALIDAVERADTLVLALPVYNFTVPAPFKAWLDQVIRPGRTVRYDTGAPVGQLGGRRVFVCSASLGDYSLTRPRAAMNFHEPYLRVALGFVGLTDVHFLHVHGMTPDVADATWDEAMARLDALLGVPDATGAPAAAGVGGG